MADAALIRSSSSFDPRYTNIVRGVILLAASAMAGWSVITSHQPWYLLALVAAGAAYVLVTMVAPSPAQARFAGGAPAAARAGEPGSTFTTVVDILVITAIVSATGGISSEYYLLYYLPVVGAAVRRNPRDGIAASILGAALYTFLTLWHAAEGPIMVLGYVRAATVCVSAATLVAFLTVLRREVDLSQSLRAALRESLGHTGAAYDVAHAANTGADFASVLLILLDHAKDATGAEAGSIAMLGPDGELQPVALAPLQGSEVPRPEGRDGGPEGLATPSLRGTSPSGERPSRMGEPDFRSEEARRAVATGSPTTAGAGKLVDLQGHPAATVLYVPLTGPGGVIGLLGLVSKPGHQFSWPQVSFLRSLSSEAAIAIENAQLRAEMRRLATTDYLTGLPNRREADRLLDVEFQRAARYGRPLTLLMLDMDGLKAVNDRFGHAAGDETLCALGRVLRREIRSSDAAGRMGGDEFLVLLPETACADGERLGQRLIESFRAELLRADSLEQAARDLVGLSIGVGFRDSGQPKPEDVLALADAALYEAKRQGKNQVRTAVPAAAHAGQAARAL